MIPVSLSPILPLTSTNPTTPSYFYMNDSYLLNQDNTFAMPLTILNETYVFNPFPNLNESKPLIVPRYTQT